MVETERNKQRMNSWTRAKTETNGASASGPYVPLGMKTIGEVR